LLKNGHVELAEILINNGADLEIKNDDGDTALMLAVRSEHSTLVDLLCKHGCNRHALGFDHIDPIDYAINKRNQYLSDVLLKHERKLYTPVSQCGSSPLNESSSLGPNLHNSIIDDLKSDSSIQHEDTANKSLNLDSNYSVFQSD
jgi:ankyrin repeat protein